MRGIFYNSKKALCSIWESGKMCYDALQKSEKYTLDYSEEQVLDSSYDFIVYNQHFHVNNWITEKMVKTYGKIIFCIVTEVGLTGSPIRSSPNYFSHYIVLDPTIVEQDNIHSFGRPIEDFELSTENKINYDIPNIFSFGFSTNGKEWHKIVELVQSEYDKANIHFNIPKATYVPEEMFKNEINKIYNNCKSIIVKPGIFLKITFDDLSKDELIHLCSKQTINCFFYYREHVFTCGLAAVTDQAISSGRPLLVTGDSTFRHIHKYIDFFPNTSIRQAIEKSKDGVLKMKSDWSSTNFMKKFENILL